MHGAFLALKHRPTSFSLLANDQRRTPTTKPMRPTAEAANHRLSWLTTDTTAFPCSSTKPQSESKPATAATAASPFAGRSSSRAEVRPAATAAMAATSSWNPASATTRWCISASIPNTKPSADATAKAPTKPAARAKTSSSKFLSAPSFTTPRPARKCYDFSRPTSASSSPTADAAAAATPASPPRLTRRRASTKTDVPAKSAPSASN